MTLKAYLRKKYAEQKKEWAEDRAFAAKLATAKKKAYRKSLLKEKVKASQEVARVETKVKLEKWKAQMGYTQPPTPSVRRIVRKIKDKKGRKHKKDKRKKFIKKVIKTQAPSRVPVASKPNGGYNLYGDITRGLPS